VRIISTVPSQTELLYDLGLDDEVVGITRFCVHPDEWFRNKTRIGGTKDLKLERIRDLKPDLIIANKEENTKEQIEELARAYEVILTNVKTWHDCTEMIRTVALRCNREKQGEALIQSYTKTVKSLKHTGRTKSCLYLIWKDPYMTVGGDTYINSMLELTGFDNLYQHITRYPSLNLAQIRQLNPDVLMLSSEPYPFGQKHVNDMQELLPDTKCCCVNGEFFSWYGSRLIKIADESRSMLRALHD